MNLAFSADDLAFRDDMRALFAANKMFCLVRTKQRRRRQEGKQFFL